MRFPIPVVVAISLLVATAQADAQVRPNASWRQIQSQNFTIIYEEGLDSIASHAAAVAEREHHRLAAALTAAPKGRIDIVIADNMDISNGNARPFPNNRVTIWIRPPVEELSLQRYGDWIDLVVTHEVTHIFHLDRAGRFGRAVRSVFGRVPWAWPIFPNIGVPRWNTEGLATLVESRHTDSGRLNGSYHEMVVRTDILENAFPTIDRISGESPLWPGGVRAYIYGSLFMDYIERRYGEIAHSRVIEKSAGSLIPPPWRMDAIAKKATVNEVDDSAGRSYSQLYDDWRRELEATYAVLADSLKAQGLTAPERITTTGRWALHPRVSPDSRKLAYADENGRDVSATRIIDLTTGEDERIRRNGIGRVAWLPDSRSILTEQLEFADRYSIQSDLYIDRDSRTTRLTKGGRAESPDVSPDGKRVVYIQNANGSNRIVVREIETGRELVLIDASPRNHWILPRWSPDGRRIAVQYWTAGTSGDHSIAIINVPAALDREFNTETGVDGAPAWSPDGRYILFSSDRTGISNIYAYTVDGGEVRQVTNVLGGAFYPEVSPDGKWIYFSGYHSDGFHIERIPYDPSSWRMVQRSALPDVMRRVVRDTSPPSDNLARLSPPDSYSAIPSLSPKYWIPLIDFDDVAGKFLGAYTSGEDAVQRHAYFAALGADVRDGRVMGDVEYTYAGLGNPSLTLRASRLWDNTGWVAIRNEAGSVVDTAESYDREDRIALTASFVNRKWRASNAISVGIEGIGLNRYINHAIQFTDPKDRMYGVLAGASFGSYRFPALAISPEDGVRASAIMRQRFEIDPAPNRDRGYREISGFGAAYKSLPFGGFAHHVIAARFSALHRNEVAPGPTDIGGSDGLLSVRGYQDDVRVGFRAWTASLEYRMPVSLIASGYQLRPLFVDRVAGAIFVDFGNASCTEQQRAIYLSCPGNPGRPQGTVSSAGVEVSANVAVLSFIPTWIRAGIALPLAGERRTAQLYVTFAPAF